MVAHARPEDVAGPQCSLPAGGFDQCERLHHQLLKLADRGNGRRSIEPVQAVRQIDRYQRQSFHEAVHPLELDEEKLHRLRAARMPRMLKAPWTISW